MAAPPVLRWSIHSREILWHLEQAIAWLYPSPRCGACKRPLHPGLGCGELEEMAKYFPAAVVKQLKQT